MMTTRKLQRRRSAVRELIRKLVTPPFCENAPMSGGMPSLPRPALVHTPRFEDGRRARGYLHHYTAF